MRCTAVQRVSKVGFDWIFEIRVRKLMRITCVFNAFSTRIRQGQIDGRWCMCALRSPAGKGMTSRLSFVVSNFELVTFPLVSRSGLVLNCIDS